MSLVVSIQIKAAAEARSDVQQVRVDHFAVGVFPAAVLLDHEIEGGGSIYRLRMQVPQPAKD